MDVYVKNTGDVSHEFIVGLTIVDSKGEEYDIPYKNVYLKPGKSKTIEFSFELPTSIVEGRCEAIVSIWEKDTGGGKLENRLDRDDQYFNLLVDIEEISIGELAQKWDADPSPNNAIFGKRFIIRGYIFFSTKPYTEMAKDGLSVPIGIVEAFEELAGKIFNAIKDFLFNEIEFVGIYGNTSSDGKYLTRQGTAPLLLAYCAKENLWPKMGDIVEVEGTMLYETRITPVTPIETPVFRIEKIKHIEPSGYIPIVKILGGEILEGERVFTWGLVTETRHNKDGTSDVVIGYVESLDSSKRIEVIVRFQEGEKIPINGSLIQVKGILELVEIKKEGFLNRNTCHSYIIDPEYVKIIVGEYE